MLPEGCQTLGSNLIVSLKIREADRFVWSAFIMPPIFMAVNQWIDALWRLVRELEKEGQNLSMGGS